MIRAKGLHEAWKQVRIVGDGGVGYPRSYPDQPPLLRCNQVEGVGYLPGRSR